MRVSWSPFLALIGSTLSAASFVTVTCGSQMGLPIYMTSTDTSTSCTSFAGGASYNTDFINGGSRAIGQVVLTLASNPADYSTLTTSQSATTVQANPRESILGRGTAARI